MPPSPSPSPHSPSLNPRLKCTALGFEERANVRHQVRLDVDHLVEDARDQPRAKVVSNGTSKTLLLRGFRSVARPAACPRHPALRREPVRWEGRAGGAAGAEEEHGACWALGSANRHAQRSTVQY